MSGTTAFRNISVVLTGTSFGLASSLHRAALDVDAFGSHVQANRGELSKWKLAAAGVAIGSATIIVGLGASVKAAADFQTQMANVNSISYLSTQQLTELGNQVIALSKTLPQSATTLASGLYNIASSGFQGADGLTVLTAAGEAASAGLTDTATSAQAITAVLNAYGLAASKSGDVSDALFQTVNLGVVSFSELAGTIGDVVGLAADAGVDINQVGAAIATMTLSGISGAEAGTSLNRVIQGLINPSDALQAVFHQLGYESGLTALQTKGLNGVMEDLKRATGGNADTMLELFPDVRAVRGALALLSQDGQLYNKVAAQITDKTNVQGATQRALAEQMKAASYQWHLFVNNVTADAIMLGTKLLPTLVDVLHATQQLTEKGIAKLDDVIRMLGPTWTSLRTIGLDIAEVLGAVYRVAGPVTGALLAIGGGATIEGLNLLATTLQSIAGFLTEHKAIVAAVVALYLAKFIPTLALAAVNLGRMAAFGVFKGIATGLTALGVGAGRAALGVTSLAAAFTLANIAAGGIMVAFALFAGGMAALANDTSKANAEIAKLTTGANPTDFAGTQKLLDNLRQQAISTLDIASKSQSILGRLHAGEQLVNPFEANSIDEAASHSKAAADAYAKLSEQLTNVKRNARDAATQAGALTGAVTGSDLGGQVDAIEQKFATLADSAGIDLTQPLAQSGGAVKALAQKWADLQKTAGGGITEMVQSGQIDVDTLQDITKSISAAGDAAAKSFSSAEDIIGGFSLTATADDVKKAQKTLTDAQAAAKKANESAASTEDKLSGKRKLTVAQQNQLTDAQDKATTATQNVTQAQQDLADVTAKAAHPDEQYKQFLAGQLKQAQDFVTGVQSATKRGLNQNTVAQLLAAGPQAAAPVLSAIAADQSGNLIRLVNQTQATLATLNRQTVEDARITQMAIQSGTDQMSKDLSTAMSIDSLEINSPHGLTADDVATKLGLSTHVAKRIGDEFGITFAQATQQTISANAAEFSARFAQPTSSTYRSQVPFHRAAGGLLDGPGTTTSDSIPVMASRGEYVNRARSVAYYGADFFDALNSMRLPRFAVGGLVGGGGTGGHPGTVTYQTVINVEKVVTPDPNAFIAEMDRRKRLANLSGRANG